MTTKIIYKYSNCLEIVGFVNACDNIIDEAKNEIRLLKKITERYFAKRVLNEAVPEEWIQAILDSNSGRKKGNSGEKLTTQKKEIQEYLENNKNNYWLNTAGFMSLFSE